MKSTPMLEQYWTIKSQQEDALLMFRLGDFYELFGEDAKIAAPILDIALTARNRNTENEIAMCGIPHHSANNYIVKLVQKGHKVAICDQVSDPSLPGIVERKITQVITPGSIDLLSDIKAVNTYTTAITSDTIGFYIASLELTSGTLQACHTKTFSQLLDELARLNPAEIIVPEAVYNDEEFKQLRTKTNSYFFPYATPDQPETFIKKHFGLSSLRGFGFNSGHSEKSDKQSNAGYSAALSLLLKYVKEHQKATLDHIQHPRFYAMTDYMILDKNALEHLDIFENRTTAQKKACLYDLLNETQTPQGARLLAEWLKYPLRDQTGLAERLETTDFFYSSDDIRRTWRALLAHVGDFEKVIGKIHLRRINPKAVRSLADWYEYLVNHPKLPNNLSDTLKQTLEALADNIQEITNTILPEPSVDIEKGGVINPEHFPALAEKVTLSKGGKQWLSSFEQQEREKTGINSLKVSYNKVFGYYIEVSKSNIAKVPESYVRKQTLVNAERYITDELKNKETEILQAEEQAIAMEKELFGTLLEVIIRFTPQYQTLSTLTATIDIHSTFAELSRQKQYVRPEFVEERTLSLLKSRHPVLEQPHLNRTFIPNTIELAQDNSLMLITGPNMGGKSTILRQSALICIMAQIGCFVPAEQAVLSPLDRIFTRIGASDALTENASTFMVEMEDASRILASATKNSLVLLDELGRGTSTYDGLSLAWSITETLHDSIGAFTLFATHYHELIALIDTLEHAANVHMGVTEKEGVIEFLYALQSGGSSESYGLEVASLAGIPEPVIAKARTILSELEKGSIWEDRQDNTLHHGVRDDEDQLQLFSSRETAIEAKLKRIDINSLTPLEALQELSSLKDQLGIK